MTPTYGTCLNGAQHAYFTVNVDKSAHVVPPPAEIAFAAPPSGTATGIELAFPEPSPIRPLPASPQQYTSPFDFNAQAPEDRSTETDAIPVIEDTSTGDWYGDETIPIPNCPNELDPQQ